MMRRRFGTAVWLVVTILVSPFVFGGRAGTPPSSNLEPALRIVTPGVSEVVTQDVTPEIAQSLHMAQPHGVLVSDVEPSPLRPGDVILSINGQPVGCENQLHAALAHVASGESFEAEIFRDGTVQNVTLQRSMDVPPPPAVLPGTTAIRGIQVASLSNQHGVIVTDVQIGTAASSTGLTRGDIILEVDGHPVRSANEFVEFVRQLNNQNATFNVLHPDGRVDVFAISPQP